MHKITPEYLTESVNFNAMKPDWHYDRAEVFSIPKIQAEGAAKLWNQLLDKKIGLLADEVGMGKTIQALAVMTTLWQQKPDAKVLLYAPNATVALKWIREYDNFLRYHYRVDDNEVKSAIKGLPLRKAVYCENHLELMEKVNSKWPSFYVCKTSSLSGFLSPKIDEDALANIGVKMTKFQLGEVAESKQEEYTSSWMYQFGKKCNDKIYNLLSGNASDEPPFDLIIFDEAHYLRRSEGHSNRSIAAHAFFAGRDIRSDMAWSTFKPLGDKVLLLTATPNHSSPNDIVNITSLFQPLYRTKKPFEILEDICVRRFRRLAGKTKHEYRHETGEGVEMNALSERLFFAGYHKALVKAKADAHKKDGQKRKMDNPYRVLFGYLEGFEFLPQKIEEGSQKQQQEGTDFTKREDSKVIVDLSHKYKQAYKARPEHPKYRKIIEGLQPNLSNNYAPHKKLVFVRRIASVYEISNRVIEDYDKAFYELLQTAFCKKELRKMEKNPRAFFWNLSKNEVQQDEDHDKKTKKKAIEAIEGISDINSKILSLFTKKKEGKFLSTDCSNFRNRFLKKESIFSVFFEPGVDYQALVYKLTSILQNQNGINLYKSTAQKLRNESITESESNKLILEQHYEFNKDEYGLSDTDQTLETIFTIWLSYDFIEAHNADLVIRARSVYHQFSLFEKEGFSSYLESGILFSSQFILRFYVLYRKVTKGNNKMRGEDLYSAFCKEVRLMMEESGLSVLIAKAVLTFTVFYKKEVGATEANLFKESWSFLKNTLPVYPYSGDTKRESIIKAFNSPFYPDVIVSTSVLQEGVDLHYHCSELIHYGIAWTQGDNEQRVGRVDRMFGKIDNLLQENPASTLKIHYPYLKNTMDQDQMARFILRKHESERLLDQLKAVQFGNELNLKQQVSEEVWQKCFNVPCDTVIETDPFPVNYEKEFAHLELEVEPLKIKSQIQGYLNPLLNSIQQHFPDEFIVFENENLHDDDESVFAIKHIRQNHSQRHQPIIGELYYSEQGLFHMGIPVYCLRISSPLASNNRKMEGMYKYGLLKNVYNKNPLLKLCLDKTSRGLYKYYVCADLPLFHVKKKDYNLSHEEIIAVIENVIEFSDDLERLIHGESYDIKNEQFIEDNLVKWSDQSHVNLPNDRNTLLTKGWVASANDFYLFKERVSESCSYDEAYAFNHEHHFLRKISEKGQTKIQVGIYKNDALDEECLLLDNVLKFI